MNINGDFGVQGEEDVVPGIEPDLSVNEENQPVDPVDQDTVIVPVEEFTEEVILSEIPEVEEDIKGMAALESALVELSYVAEDILKSGGVNQVIALEADRCIEGFLHEDRPLGFYTKTPSATNLQYAMEAIDLKKAGIIAAIIAAVMGVLYKVYQFFTKSPAEGGGPSGGKSEKDIKDEAEEVAERAKSYKECFDDVNRNVQGGTDGLMSDVAKSSANVNATKHILEEMDGLEYDIMSNHSVMIAKIESFIKSNNGVRGLKILLNEMMTAADSIYETSKKQIGSFMIVDQAESKPQIKKMAAGTHPVLDPNFSSLKYEGKAIQIGDIKNDLRSTMNDLKAQTKKIGKYSDVARNLDTVLNMKLVVEYAAMSDEFVSSLKIFNDKIENIKKLVTTKSLDTGSRVVEVKSYEGEKELANALQVLGRMHSDLASIILVMYTVLIQVPDRTISRFQKSLKEAQAYVKKMKHEYATNGRAESHPQEMERIEEMIKAFSNLDKK